jgi:hypothetical protein
MINTVLKQIKMDGAALMAYFERPVSEAYGFL